MSHAVTRKDNRKTFRVTYSSNDGEVSRRYPSTPRGEYLAKCDISGFVKACEAEEKAARVAERDAEILALATAEPIALVDCDDLFALLP